MKQPKNEEIIKALEKILMQESTREEIADWAMGFIDDDDIEITDFSAWELLKTAGGVDLINCPEEYLYSHEDIRKWIADALKQS